MKKEVQRWLDWLLGVPRLPRAWDLRLNTATFTVLDTETTGLDPRTDRILSIGAIKVQNNRIRAKENMEVFLEQDYFDGETVPIHGILPQGGNDRTHEKAALQRLLDFADGTILVGHHLAFDLKMLNRALSRWDLPLLSLPCLDTGLLYGKSLINSPLLTKKELYTLDDLADKFDLSCKDRHTALGDAYITALAFLHILERLESRKELTLRGLLKMGGIACKQK